jgi:putative spermidine/putrescine transport system substrate-binding protein
VRKLYVQPGDFLGPEPSRFISMLPTVHNLDSFGYDTRIFGRNQQQSESWAWLLDPRARGRIALVDEPAIGLFDVALAAEAAGELQFADIGNMTVAEIDALMALLNDRRQQGYFRAIWRNAAEASRLIRDDEISVQSMWSPAYNDLGDLASVVVEASPVEGYRAWHGGMSLARHLGEAELAMSYEYMNWWLSGWPGAVMARQGYYMSALEPVKAALTPAEWAYWYEGAPAASELPGPDGRPVVRRGATRPGGSYWERAGHIAVWNTTMDEHNYAARAWERFVARVRGGAS